MRVEIKTWYCRYLFVNGFPGVKSFNLVLRINLFGKFTVFDACGKICKSRIYTQIHTYTYRLRTSNKLQNDESKAVVHAQVNLENMNQFEMKM